MDVKNYVCPNCGAPLKFDSNLQKLHCDYCDSTYTIEEMEKFSDDQKGSKEGTNINWKKANTEDISETMKEFTNYNCPSCGAEIICDENTTATSCIYCGNPTLIPKTAEGIYKPDYLIPFKLDKKDAKQALKDFYKGKILLPKEFKQDTHIDKISGVYVPFWLFDCAGSADMNFMCTRVTSWSDSDYNYTKTDYYSVQRSGNIAFDKIPVDGASKMPDNFMDSIEPFDYRGFVDFNISYLSGYMADKYDVDSEASEPRANERVENTIEAKFKETVTNYATVNTSKKYIDMQAGEIKYVLLPVWMLNKKYKDKTYTFAMNGQTGKLVGNLPSSIGKMICIGTAITAATMAIGNIVMMLL